MSTRFVIRFYVSRSLKESKVHSHNNNHLDIGFFLLCYQNMAHLGENPILRCQSTNLWKQPQNINGKTKVFYGFSHFMRQIDMIHIKPEILVFFSIIQFINYSTKGMIKFF